MLETPPSAAGTAPALIIVNPVAGRGRGVQVAREVQAGLAARGLRAQIHATARRGDARAWLRSQTQALELVVSIGGDGTLREVLSGLVRAETPVGILPMGTANVLARDFGLPRDVHAALEIYCAGRTQALDVALVNGHLACLGASVGFDASAVQRVDARRSGPIGLHDYAIASLACLARYREPRLSIRVDGQALPGEFGWALVAGTRTYGGWFQLSRNARPDDRLLELYALRRASRLRLARVALRGWLAAVEGGVCEVHRARAVRIESAEPRECQIDGDSGGRTPLAIELAPAQYRLLVP
jgi:diacylglycerol kinase (ATP)